MAVLAGAVVAFAAGLAESEPGVARFDPQTDRETLLVSRSADAGFPNGPSRNGVFSQDRQLARYLAFESDASDIVAGDANGFSDVFVVPRARRYGRHGTPWRPARAKLASAAPGGRAANGSSYGPDLDGDQRHKPRCVAFVSAASNLVRGDTNGVPDAFVRDLRTGRITRVSVTSAGRQANGPTVQVRIDGGCSRVAFVARAPNLALTRTGRRAWAPARTRRPSSRVFEVYVRIFKARGKSRPLRGLTFLASASRSRRASNGHSFDVSFARSGQAVAFTSLATNLSDGDRHRRSDVYERTFARVHGSLKLATKLVSATRKGRAGNGASDQPAVNESGRYVAFRTDATNLLAGDQNHKADVARADTRRRHPRIQWVSRSAAVGSPGNGPSARPTIGRPGTPVFFESDAGNLQPFSARNGVYFDRNGTGDIFFWNSLTRNVSLQSRDSDNQLLGQGYPYCFTGEHAAPASRPATSYYGNYVLFESSYPLIDLPIAHREFPGLGDEPCEAERASRRYPPLHQVYLRYIGPR